MRTLAHARRFLRFSLAVLTIVPVAAATTAGAVALAGPAGAATEVSCGEMSGNIGSTITVHGCGDGLRWGTVSGVSAPGGGTITWGGKRSLHKGITTIGNVNAFSTGQHLCSTGSMEWQFTGTVTANTSPADILGTSVFGMMCVDAAGNVSLVERHLQLVL